MPSLPREARRSTVPSPEINPAAEIVNLQRVMNEHVGPLRTAKGLQRALDYLTDLKGACAEIALPRGPLDAEWVDLHDLRNMRLVAECVARAALAREESRGAHQRSDFPEASDGWLRHQLARLSQGELQVGSET